VTEIKVCTYNAGGQPTDTRLAQDWQALKVHGVRVLGVSEVGRRTGALLRSGFNVYRLPNDKAAGFPSRDQIALLVHPDHPVERWDADKLNDPTPVERAVAGARLTGVGTSKYVVWADVAGVRYGETHLIPSTMHRTKAGEWANPKARALYVKQVAALVAWFERGGDVLVGDLNNQPPNALLAPLRKVAVAYTAPSFVKDNRELDHVWIKRGPSGAPKFAVTDVRALQGYAGDHRPVVATLDVPAPKEGDVKPYDLTTYDGRRVDWLTRAALEDTAARLRYADGKLTLTQGSYNAGKVGASAGTHDGGGVVDLSAYDHERKVRELRRTGFAAWYRPAIKGLWPAHIHAVLIGNAKLSPSAARQVTAYLNGRNGLADNGADNGPRDFVKNRYTWTRGTPPKPKPPTAVESFQKELAALLDKYQGRILKRRVGAHKMLHDIRARAAKGPQK
jgi:hypothetical protein